MSRKIVSEQRRVFLRNFAHGLRVVWPIFSSLLLCIVAMSLWVGWLEGWNAGDSLYFGFVTALTIGYGDFVPTTATARVLSVLLGTIGFVYTGILAAVAVHAMRTTVMSDGKESKDPW